MSSKRGLVFLVGELRYHGLSLLIYRLSAGAACSEFPRAVLAGKSTQIGLPSSEQLPCLLPMAVRVLQAKHYIAGTLALMRPAPQHQATKDSVTLRDRPEGGSPERRMFAMMGKQNAAAGSTDKKAPQREPQPTRDLHKHSCQPRVQAAKVETYTASHTSER